MVRVMVFYFFFIKSNSFAVEGKRQKKKYHIVNKSVHLFCIQRLSVILFRNKTSNIVYDVIYYFRESNMLNQKETEEKTHIHTQKKK